MLFFAVFLGFVAENIREDSVIRKKEKIYIAGIIQNLKDDTSRIPEILNQQIRLLKKMDSALLIPVEELHDLNKQDTFYHHFLFFYVWLASFEQNDNTLIQLRNAGGYSVIHNQSAIDSITRLSKFYSNIVGSNGSIYSEDWKAVANLAPTMIRITSYPSDMYDSVFFTMPHQTEFFTQYNKPLIQELYSWTRVERGQLILYKNVISLYRLGAIRLIQFLQKEYHM